MISTPNTPLPKKYARSFNPISDRAALVRRLVQFNNIEGALERLEEYTADFSNTDRDEVTMYKSTYYAWLNESRDRTTTQENLDIKIARVRKGILDLTQKLP